MAEGPTLPEWSEYAEGEAFDGEVNGTDISETLERVLDADACEGEPYSAWERWSEMTARTVVPTPPAPIATGVGEDIPWVTSAKGLDRQAGVPYKSLGDAKYRKGRFGSADKS
ncbi:hypothetical protein [Cupriavidus basilensis]|uniref:Uncharacterized protein n=1 Tax=Cupriavidus basilensis TaxID=68895 RepID=A0A643FZY2_9BURK|nr:hypothetical protein [Cupriavidus basilensis]QOT80310.1 hypothetical protein F7R26_022900 [Cupriavidus basilensis]